MDNNVKLCQDVCVMQPNNQIRREEKRSMKGKQREPRIWKPKIERVPSLGSISLLWLLFLT